MNKFNQIKAVFVKLNEGIAAAMLAALFFTFVLQVFSRYVLRSPFGWTLEVCLTLWVWLVFWGNSFILHHDHHVAFDLLLRKLHKKLKIIFSLIGSLSIVISFAYAYYPILDFIDFLEIRDSYVLRLPMDKVFSVYIIFMTSIMLIYIWRTLKIIKERDIPEMDSGEKIEGDML